MRAAQGRHKKMQAAPPLPLKIILLSLALLAIVPGVVRADEAPAEPILRIETGMHNYTIRTVLADPQRRYLATVAIDGTARTWTLDKGRPLRVFRPPIGTGNEGKLFDGAISPDGETLATGGWTGYEWDTSNSVYLFDTATGKMRGRISDIPNVITDLAFSPDGRYLAVLHIYGVRLYDRKDDYRMVAEDSDYSVGAYVLDFDHKGRLATSSYDGYIRLYSPELELLTKAAPAPGERPRAVSFSPDGTRIAVGFLDNPLVRVISASDLSTLFDPDINGVSNGDLSATAWSANGEMLYAAGQYDDGDGNPIIAWAKGGRGARSRIAAADNTVMDLHALADGRLAWGSGDPAFGLADAAGETIYTRTPEIGDFRSLRQNFLVSHDGSIVQFGYELRGERPARFSLAERSLKSLPQKGFDLVAEVQARLAQRGFDPGPPDGVSGPRTEQAIGAFQREHGMFADGEIDDALVEALGIEMLEPPLTEGLALQDAAETYTPMLNGEPLPLENREFSRAYAIAPGNERFVLATEWNLRSFSSDGEQIWERSVPDVAWAVNITGDGQTVVAAFADGTIRWYRLEDGEPLLALFPHVDGERWVAWTPQGYYQASAGAEDLIGWHLNRGKASEADFFGASRFRGQFYRPDVVARVLDTADVDEAVRLADASRGVKSVKRDLRAILPPTVNILAPKAGAKWDTERLVLTYRAVSDTGPIEKIEARVNGRPAEFSDARISGENDDYIGRIDLKIPPDDVEVTLLARNQNGWSEPARFPVNWAGKQDWYKSELYVLAVGVSSYSNPRLNLTYAAKDALDFVAAIREQENRGLYKKISIRLLPDEKASKDAILDGMDWLQRETTSRDVAMVFISGHGISDPKGEYRFLPHDVDEARLKRTTIREAEFIEYLGDIKGKAVAFLDTCHSGDVFGGTKTTKAQADVDKFANELASAESGVIVYTSSSGSQFSKENKDWANGAFTEALLEAVHEGKADFTHDRHVSTAELEEYLSDRVKELTNGAQTPKTARPTSAENLKIARVRP